MSFIYPFFNFLQPGILFPELADLRPMLIASFLALFMGLMRRSEYPRRIALLSPVAVWLYIYIVAQVLSVSYGGLAGMYEELYYWGTYGLFFVVSILIVSNPGNLGRYVWGMMLGGIFVVVYGIYAVFAWKGYAHTGRAGAYGMYENHNDYTFIIIQIFPYLYFFRRLSKNFFARNLLGLAMIACVIGVFMSLSRGGILALLSEFLLIILLTMSKTKKLILLPLLAVVASSAIAYQWHQRAVNQGAGYTAEDAETGRYELWKAGIAMFMDKPLLGVGSRRFEEYAKEYRDLGHDLLGKNSHNTFVEVLAGSGILGFVPFVMMLFRLSTALRGAASERAPPVVEATRLATLITLYSIIFRALLDAKPHDWSFYTLAAIGVACVSLAREGKAPETSVAHKTRPVTVAARRTV